MLEAKNSGDGAKDQAEDDIEGKADDSDRDDTDADNERFDAETLASVDESFDAHIELRKHNVKYNRVILKEHKVKVDKEAITMPSATAKNRNVSTTPSTTTPQSRKRPARTPSSSDRKHVTKKNKTEDSPGRKELRERVVKAKEKQANYVRINPESE